MMYDLGRDRVILALKSQHLTATQIHILLDRYPKLDDRLGKVVEQWLVTQEYPNVEVDGISALEVMQKRQCHFLTALRDLNKLLDPTLSPEKRERWRRILTTQVYFE